MSIVSESKNCPKCGVAIPAEAPQGLCPKCLLLEISTPTDAGQSGKSKSIPPTRDELAAAFPHLEILELIGQGGMGFVFKARQPKLDRFVALKILPQSLAADPAFAERFSREGRLLARLNHPNIVTVHDFGVASGILPDVETGFQPGGKDVDEGENEQISNAQAKAVANSRGMMPRSTSGGTPDATGATEFFYLLMEYVDGVNLRQAMRAGRFTADQALAVVPKICEALQFAHNEGILHRDIKPENILLDTKGRVKIADFGIAKLISEASIEGQGKSIGDATLTQTGKTLGTPNYMAPEQMEKSGAVDHRADIYSLGVVFYEMLTGELPLGRFAPPSQKSAADPRLDDVVLRALEKEPNRRTQSAGEMKTQVETITTDQPPLIPDTPNSSVKPKKFLPHGVMVCSWVFILVVLITTIVTFLLPETYDAFARIKVEKSSESNIPYESYDPFWLQTQFEVIRSESVLTNVTQDLKLGERWSLRNGGQRGLERSETMALLKQALVIRPTSGTSLIEIHFFSKSSIEAAEIANAIARSYATYSHREGRGIEIVDAATPPSRSARPNKLLNIALGVIAGIVIGVLAGLITVLVLHKKHPPENAAPPASPVSDRFWKRFAVVVGLVLLAMILVPVLGLLLAIAWPAFQKARHTQEIREQIETQKQSTTIKSDYIGKTHFPRGDSIEIISVERSRDRMMVKGHYNLVSEDNAQLALYITSTNGAGANVHTDREQWTNIFKGTGDFELSRSNLSSGLPHVSMYANGKSFAGIYFGTKEEAQESGKLILTQANLSGLPEARAKLAELRIKYTDGHPIVRAHLSRLRELERMTEEEPNASAALRDAKAKLAEARLKFTDEHPEVRKLKERVRELEDK